MLYAAISGLPDSATGDPKLMILPQRWFFMNGSTAFIPYSVPLNPVWKV